MGRCADRSSILLTSTKKIIPLQAKDLEGFFLIYVRFMCDFITDICIPEARYHEKIILIYRTSFQQCTNFLTIIQQ